MGNEIFFSILIPNLNFGNTLLKCFNSALQQKTEDLFSYEIIVCDQSDKMVFSRIQREVNKLDQNNKIRLDNVNFKSLFLARHYLMKESRGRYIVFLDSDDYIEPDYLMTLYNYISVHKPDLLIVDFFFEKNNGEVIKKTHISMDDQKFLCDLFLFSNSLNSICRKIFLRSKYNFDDYSMFNCIIGEDKVFSYPIIKNSEKISYCPICKYHYVQNNDSMMAKMTFDSYFDYLINTVKDSDLINISSVGKKYFAKFILDSFLNSTLYVQCQKDLVVAFCKIYNFVREKILIGKIKQSDINSIKRKFLLFFFVTNQKRIIYHVVWKRIVNKNGTIRK